MMDYSSGNKRAWEYNAYEFWLKEEGPPSKKADKIRENPAAMLKKYSAYFDTYEGRKIANICGSCGKKAVPLAVLGAEVTVFDISQRFDEHPAWDNPDVPGEFTITADRGVR